LTSKNVQIKIDEMKTSNGQIKNFELSIGKVINDNYTEPMGPTPMPSMTTLRDWDMKLLTKYKLFTCRIVIFAVCALLENAI